MVITVFMIAMTIKKHEDYDAADGDFCCPDSCEMMPLMAKKILMAE